ncbi:hypothetical protein [Tumebacillus lipolyticus]|uniref:Uncharacterized protein n=1 Tax=Tumebacillus lipolyticus TaxID=1280370 RepID=A0ABW5A113_9BACL
MILKSTAFVTFTLAILFSVGCSNSIDEKKINSIRVSTTFEASPETEDQRQLSYSIQLINQNELPLNLEWVEPVLSKPLANRTTPHEVTIPIQAVVPAGDQLTIEGVIQIETSAITDLESQREEAIKGVTLKLTSGEEIYVEI